MSDTYHGMKWVLRIKLQDARAAGPSYYYLTKSGCWTWDAKLAREFYPLELAERMAKTMGAEAVRS
jgi:hypothetical protein